ncbi:ATP-binding cassette domain-containing protein [Magnetococcus sp. PR-3]|uniref:ATP-binding cassette domain-containing protein n=1 Tax=Magnetococcus sp. PR-3 TaxID=3120355 RepID=UPI002FCE4BB5
MQELLRRLLRRPVVFMNLLFASFMVNFLALGVTFYAMNVMKRYTTFGVEETLYTLMAGIAMVLILENVFQRLQMRLARSVSAAPDAFVADSAFDAVVNAQAQQLDGLDDGVKMQVMRHLDDVQKAFGTRMLVTVFDLPFSFLFIGVLYILEPRAGIWVSCLAVFVFIYGLIHQYRIRKPTEAVSRIKSFGNRLMGSAVGGLEDVRAFNHHNKLMDKWRVHRVLRQQAMAEHEKFQEAEMRLTTGLTMLAMVGVITIAAHGIFEGTMSMGMMLGINILAMRSLTPVIKFATSSGEIAKGRQATLELNQLLKLAREPKTGTRLNNFTGRVAFKDMAFAYPGGQGPLFESLNLELVAGDSLVVTGSNGAGKSTLAKLLMGIYHPIRGHLLIDGVDLRQMDLSWWRTNVMYLPQEPLFMNASIADNLCVNNPEIDEEGLERIINMVELREFIDHSEAGLQTQIVNQGNQLSLGIRRRLAIARALASRARVTIFDEPTEGLDQKGQKAVYQILSRLSQEGSTMILFTNDPNITRVPNVLLNLDVKPIPELTRRQMPKPAKPAEPSKAGGATDKISATPSIVAGTKQTAASGQEPLLSAEGNAGVGGDDKKGGE